MSVDYADLLIASTCEVFETMSFLEVTPLSPVTQTGEIVGVSVSAMISLAGEISGVLFIHCADDFARECAEQISGEGEAVSPAQLADTVGELANMVAGSLKRKMSALIDLFELSLPLVIAGHEHRIVYNGAKENFPRILIPFAVDNEIRFYVELLHHKR